MCEDVIDNDATSLISLKYVIVMTNGSSLAMHNYNIQILIAINSDGFQVVTR